MTTKANNDCSTVAHEAVGRRAFLAASLAAPAVALSHGADSLGSIGSVEPPATPMVPDQGPETYFWVEMEEQGGEMVPASIVGSDVALARQRHYEIRFERDADKTYRKFRFEPLDRERRFLLTETQWIVPPIYGDDGLSKTFETEAEEAVYRAAIAAFPEPVSLLDAPNLDGGEEESLPDSEWYTREDAFERAARRNGYLAAEWLEDASGVYGCLWMTVVEIGMPIILDPSLSLEVEIGVGVMSASVEYPLRHVTPTDAEKARYPFSAVLDQLEWEEAAEEGGAA